MMNWLQSSSDMAERVRQHDWANTPLGPLEQWPDVLKTTVALCFASSFPQAIVWGPQLITLYNDAFIPILGAKPDPLGRPFSEVWHEVWAQISPIADAAFQGHATYIENFPLVIERGPTRDQAYFTFCYSPIRDAEGKVVGILDTVSETTTTVFLARRPGGAGCHQSHRGQRGRCRNHSDRHHPVGGPTSAGEQLRLRRYGRR
ncbi:hypothetical protein QF043_003023 [Pseudomonas sp. W3I7]|nr:hypothetical protein [Pseudomonas sp. W3I7]